MKTDTLSYQRLESIARNYGRLQGGKLLKLSISKADIIMLMLSFLLGRATLAGGLMPFGIALFASTAGFGLKSLIIAAGVIMGMASNGAVTEIYTTAAAIMLFKAFCIPFAGIKNRISFKYSIIASLSVMIPEMVMVYLQGFLLFDLLRAMFHGFVVFSLVFVFRNAVPLIIKNRKRPAFSSEELISAVIMFSLALSGLPNIAVLSFSIKSIICILAIIIFSFGCGPGIGAAIGATTGLIISMSSTSAPLAVGAFALCGMLTGIFRSLGRPGAGMGFILGNMIMTLYLVSPGDALVYFRDILAAVLIFMVLPQKAIDMITESFFKDNDVCAEKKGYSLRIRELTVEKLNRFSRTFKELSKTFSEVSKTRVVADKQDLSVLFDRVADKVCRDCSLCLHCWDKNFYNTYQVMFKIVEKLDSKGRIEESDVPGYFLDRCERIYDFVKEVNNIYELFKVDMVWKSRIVESRGLVSQQMEGLSRVISNLASEINMDVHFKTDIEDKILLELNRNGIKASEVVAYENKWGKYEVGIIHKSCSGGRKCISVIEKLVSGILDRHMIKESTDCQKSHSNGSCALKMVEEEAFRVTTGIARHTKHNSAVSGDSYTFLNNGDGKYIIALSDGMGSGQKAANQSKATISLIEQFMESGFDKDTTVKLINSVLVLKSIDDSYATIDLAVIDLFDGEVEFVKVGAASTLIKKPDRVDVVRSASLPAGILSDIETELLHKKINSGDFIIMMTDGIIDAFDKENQQEETLQDFVRGIQGTNPQSIADNILERACLNCGDKPLDDMIVAVAKVWKRVD